MFLILCRIIVNIYQASKKKTSNLSPVFQSVSPSLSGYPSILYQLRNDAEFVKKIVALYKNPKLRIEMRKSNIEDSRKYSIDIAVRKMAEIYGECVR